MTPKPPPAEPIQAGDPEAVLKVLAKDDAYFWDVAEKLEWPEQRMLAAERVLVRRGDLIERPGGDRGALLMPMERVPDHLREKLGR